MLSLKIPSPIEVVDDHELRESTRESLNRICNMVDWVAWSPLTRIMDELDDNTTIHRKTWEYAMTILAARQFGLVSNRHRALSVGAGYERPLFFFSNHLAEMVATDLYDNPEHEGTPAMLTTPERFAPFPYARERLKVMRMAGDELRFEENSFDFVFCLSSIEHFGNRETQARSLSEMRRVVKPGGLILLATELILNDSTHHEYFTYAELESMFLKAPGLRLVGGDLDLRIARSLVEYPILLDSSRNTSVSPHITLYAGGVLLTSVMLVLQKGA